MAHATVSAARIRYHSPELHADVLHGIGFRAGCKCGWRGPVRYDRNVARQDVREHTCIDTRSGPE